MTLTLTDAQVSRLAGALDKQFEAEKSGVTALAPQQQPAGDLDKPLEVEKSHAIAPVPAPLQQIEDRSQKPSIEAWEHLKPRLYLVQYKLKQFDRLLRWLPLICFSCTLFGLVFGWSLRSWFVASDGRQPLPLAARTVPGELGPVESRYSQWILAGRQVSRQ